jgi:DNA-binding MarR family transcriptional regulator
VDRLSDQGLVRRRESAHDGRSTMVHITAKGKRTAEELMGLASSCMDRAAAVVPRRDLEALERALARVLARFDGEPGLTAG